VLRQVVRVKGMTPMETLPKWGRTRTTVLPENTIWGEPLRARLPAFLAGRDPDALMFPDSRGGWMHASNFDTRQVIPAGAAAGWPEAWTWHSNRHAFRSYLLSSDAATVARRLFDADTPSSVISLWGKTGDLVVELSQLKLVNFEIGPFKIKHDHDPTATTARARSAS
jgi:hypothetical protein